MSNQQVVQVDRMILEASEHSSLTMDWIPTKANGARFFHITDATLQLVLLAYNCVEVWASAGDFVQGFLCDSKTFLKHFYIDCPLLVK